MAFFRKLKDRLFKSSSKLEEGLDAIVEDGGEAEEVTETSEPDPKREPSPEPEPTPEREPEPQPTPEPTPEPEPTPAPEPEPPAPDPGELDEVADPHPMADLSSDELSSLLRELHDLNRDDG